MKRILVLGAGQSAPYLIRYLLDQADDDGWIVTVGDLDPDVAAARVNGHPRGEAIAIDARDEARLEPAIEGADLVINLLPPGLTSLVAHECVRQGRHMISTSYSSPKIKALSSEARQQGVLLLTEMGLDPGIDHMAGMSLIDAYRPGAQRRWDRRELRVLRQRCPGSRFLHQSVALCHHP
jgi:saccharopine dehydrogenase (NADP+, L-glutamate forming)